MVSRDAALLEHFRVDPLEHASLFERFPRLYAFLRERVFRDDTERIIATLWPAAPPAPGSTLIEIGCGPGFYARRLASRFPELSVVGIDYSTRLLELATIRAASEQLANCCFEWGDAHSIARGNESVDALIASRLFTILSDPRRAITEMHRVLHSGGRCFIAEPRPHPLARIPLNLMWTAASVATITNRGHGRYREPGEPRLLEPHEFTRLIATQPWDNIRVWTDHRYQYAVCTKA